MQTKNVYGIIIKSNDVCIDLRNWTSVNQLFQEQLASMKRMKNWQKLRYTNKLWNGHNFEYGPVQNYPQFAWRSTDQYAFLVYG